MGARCVSDMMCCGSFIRCMQRFLEGHIEPIKMSSQISIFWRRFAKVFGIIIIIIIIIRAHLLQVWSQAVVEVLHGDLLVADHRDLRVVAHWPGAEHGLGLGDAGPVASRAPVHAGRAAGEAAAPAQLHRPAHAEGAGAAGHAAGAADAAGAEAALAADSGSHDDRRWIGRRRWPCGWCSAVESLRGVPQLETAGHFYKPWRRKIASVPPPPQWMECR